MSPAMATSFPRSAPPDLRILDHARWPQTIAGITATIGMQANERIAKAKLIRASGDIRGMAAPDAAWADNDGGWSAIGPFYRTGQQMQAAVRARIAVHH